MNDNRIKQPFPKQINNPANKTEILETGNEIKEALANHFGNTGKDCTFTTSHKDTIEQKLHEIKINMNTATEICSLKVSKAEIRSQVQKLKHDKSSGIDYIPNEFLEYGTNI